MGIGYMVVTHTVGEGPGTGAALVCSSSSLVLVLVHWLTDVAAVTCKLYCSSNDDFKGGDSKGQNLFRTVEKS